MIYLSASYKEVNLCVNHYAKHKLTCIYIDHTKPRQNLVQVFPIESLMIEIDDTVHEGKEQRKVKSVFRLVIFYFYFY